MGKLLREIIFCLNCRGDAQYMHYCVVLLCEVYCVIDRE